MVLISSRLLQSDDNSPRPVGPDDVAMDILYAGVCHSDIHTVDGD